MAAPGANFGDLERNRLQLEENVAKLRKSLQYWQTWEAEYEGMKEEILRLGDDHSETELAYVADEFDGDLLNEKEINSLFRTPGGKQREGKQIVGLLSGRIDYVKENIKSVSKQVQNAEEKLAALEIISQSDFGDEGALPLTEISEELDDEGNVISSSATRAGDTTPQILEALRKAGVKDLLNTSEDAPLKSNLPTNRIEEIGGDDNSSKIARTSEESNTGQGKEEEEEEVTKPSDQAAKTSEESDKVRHLGRKKSVSFAEGTKTEDSTISRKRLPHPLFAKPKPRVTASPPKVETIAEVQAKTPEGQLNSLLQAEENILSMSDGASSDTEIVSPVIPEKESPEDAALRRQMLQYNMHELSAVVAEIDLDEQGSTPPYSSDEDDAYEDSSTEEEEDEYGRAKNVVFSEEYIKEMQALEKRLNASAIQNIGPALASEGSSMKIDKPQSSISPPTPPTKEVRFASDIDIQEAPTLGSASKQPVDAADRSSNDASQKKKVSRFKSDRNNAVAPTTSGGKSTELKDNDPTSTRRVADNITEHPIATGPSTSKPSFPPTLPPRASRPTPTGPPGRPHASHIIERPYSSTVDPDHPPSEPDEFDPALLQQQAAMAYHQQRNRLIHKQGGFLHQQEDDEAEVPVDENGEEQGRKVSRFKAARLDRKRW